MSTVSRRDRSLLLLALTASRHSEHFRQPQQINQVMGHRLRARSVSAAVSPPRSRLLVFLTLSFGNLGHVTDAFWVTTDAFRDYTLCTVRVNK